MFHSRAVVGSSITQEMNAPLKELDTQLLKSIIHSRVSIARSADGKTIFEGSDDKAKQEYKNLKKGNYETNGGSLGLWLYRARNLSPKKLTS